MNELLKFDTMLTPKVITFIYWLLLLAVVLGSLSQMFGGFGGFTVGKFFMGAFGGLVAAVFVRIWCELLIVLFKMNEALQDIRNK